MARSLPRLRTALVLGGGAARGAYEAGVIAYLRKELSRELGPEQLHVDIVSGTSVGAINACFFAGTAAVAADQGDSLVEGWKSLTLDTVLRVGPGEIVRAARELMRRT